ncbi:sulfate transporter/antisigma-factor antagonist STAS [Emticicia oligotrophica DSM 17448]|uniref:Sulfate transporter/antisigma-factor antagonist STAS n=1 Tax=Emticicia oligotrophica (strain DSM 17448 / CIP 109782 / MTCC 6937 / GPTSA100-15) TaxID=929562 RepID=A0ABN4AU64_EMTOG|nr:MULTISPECIES: STAS domain-containing protein [Emticicia]AFK05071.1 sulfate transporter/antisigma-factor antagonist STAS [Emticicia oligotrophica DSM 17448]
MTYSVEKTEHYALIQIEENKFDKSITAEVEKQIVVLYREGFMNMILDFSKVLEIDESGLSLLRKATKVCRSEHGLFIVCTKDDDILDLIDGEKIPEIVLLPTVDEGIDAVFMNDLENDFREEEDDEFDLGEENGFTEGKF